MFAKIRVWSLPIRLFHWSLVVCVSGAFISAQVDAMAWHFRFGYCILSLVLFRVLWGFMGDRYARFSQFSPNLLAAWRYVRGASTSHVVGHNPLGALSVYALLLCLSVQLVSGLFVDDLIMWSGPLTSLVSEEWSQEITTFHKLNRWILLCLIATHLSAIIWYEVVRKESLVKPMIVGDKEISLNSLAEPSKDGLREGFLALFFLSLSALSVWLISKVGL